LTTFIESQSQPQTHSNTIDDLLQQNATQVEATEEKQEQPPRWGIDICNSCLEKDTPEHAIYQCPEIKSIWEISKRHLNRLTNEARTVNPDLLRVDLNSIILCFPEARQQLSKSHQIRLQLWHSSTLYVITKTREKAIWNARDWGTHAEIHWDTEAVMKQIAYEIRGIIWKIYNKSQRNDAQPNHNPTVNQTIRPRLVSRRDIMRDTKPAPAIHGMSQSHRSAGTTKRMKSIDRRHLTQTLDQIVCRTGKRGLR
jgi:hypothetical protein